MNCILLVGGSGERLWPLSRSLYPKPLLKLCGGKTLLQNAYGIAASVVAPRNIVVVANVKQAVNIKLQLNEYVKNPTVLSEPIPKNTAAAVAASLFYLKRKKDDIVVILPVDFSISDVSKFKIAINKAKNLAKEGYITAIGVKPTYPETGYGYLKVSEPLKKGYKIEKFVEKPSLTKAKEYLEDGNYYWNCGIFVAKASVLQEAFEKQAKDIISNMSDAMIDDNGSIKFENYKDINPISFDYAIMEKVDNIAFVELETNWTDMGSWLAVYNNEHKDSKGNVLKGNVVLDKVKNSLIHSSKELVAVSGVSDTIVVETEDAVLVCPKDRTGDIKKVVSKLKKANNELVNVHKTMYRPWGYYTCLNGGKGWLTKVITVSAGQKLSLQSHNHRSEHWVVLEGTATVVLGSEVHILQKRQSINIPVKVKHSLQNHTKEPLKILEVQKGDYLSEDDIIRYEDMYGRVK